MPVVSRPMADDQVIGAAPKARRSLSLGLGLRSTWPVGAVLVIAGGLGWLAGAVFSATGLPAGVNTVFAGLLGIALALPTPRAWWLAGAAVLVGLFFSRVEVQHRPFRYTRAAAGDRGRWQLDPLPNWAAWLIIIGIDVATTYIGMRELLGRPAGAVWPVVLEIAASREYNGMASLVLTFLPELSMIAGWSLMWKRST